MEALEPVGGGQKPWLDGLDSDAVINMDLNTVTQRVKDIFLNDSRDLKDRSALVQMAQDGNPAAEREMKRLIRDILRREGYLLAGWEDEKLANTVFDYLYGLRELGPLFHDPTVEEIQVNSQDNIWVIRNGRPERTNVLLRDENSLEQFLFPRLFSGKGQAISTENPQLEHVRQDGVRITATVPPRSPQATLIVRKHNVTFLSPKEWLATGSAPERLLALLGAALRGRVSILVSGPTNSGKTTLVRLLIGYAPPDMRWVTVATDRELHLKEAYPNRNFVELELRGRGELSDIFRVILHCSPNAVVLEEIRNGDEAEIMLQTVRRGHGGSLSTLHVTRPETVALEVAKMALEGKPLDPITLNLKWSEVAESFPLVVQMETDSMRTGRRLVDEVGQYVVHAPGQPPEYQPLCVWEPSGENRYAAGGWRWVNQISTDILQTAERNGIHADQLLVPSGTYERWGGGSS